MTSVPEPRSDPSTAPLTTAGLGSRAVRNTLTVLAARVASRVIALVTIIAIGNYLTDTGFGQMQTVITYAALVNVTLDLGYGTLYVREGARHPELLSAYLATLLSFKALSAVASVAVLAAVLVIPGLENLLLPASLLMITAAYSNLLRSSLYALQRLAYEAVAIVLESALLLGLAVWGITTHQGLAFFVWTYVISYSCTIVYFTVALAAHRMIRFQWGCDLGLLRRWFGTAIAVGFTSIVTTVYFKVDVPILQQYRSYDEVGWYTLAYKPFEALLFLPFTLRNIVFPVLSVYYAAQSNRLGLATEKLYRVLLLMAWPTAIGLFMMTSQANTILRLYPQSEDSLHILAIGILFVFMDNTFIATLLAMNRQNLFFKIALAGMVFNVVLDFALIPTHGYLGASWATVITEAFLCVVGWWCLRREGVSLRLWHLSWRIFVAGGVMAAFLIPFMHVHGAAALGVMAAGAAVYAIAILALRTADADEWSLIRRALRRPADQGPDTVGEP